MDNFSSKGTGAWGKMARVLDQFAGLSFGGQLFRVAVVGRSNMGEGQAGQAALR